MNVINNKLANKNISRFLVFLTLLFFITISTSYAVTDSNQSNNVMSVNVDVVETEVLSISFVHYAENESDDVSGYDSLVNNQADFISNVYPLRDDAPFIKRDHDDIITINPNDGVCDLINTLARKASMASINTSRIVGIISQASSNKFANSAAGFWCSGTSPQAVIVTEKIINLSIYSLVAPVIANLDSDGNELIDLYAHGCFVSSINKKVICGSSASAAYVAGAIALIIGYAKDLGVNLNPDEVKRILIESSTQHNNLNGDFAGKQIDIEKALKYLENKYGKTNKKAEIS